jgi:methionyl aminopeptidase
MEKNIQEKVVAMRVGGHKLARVRDALVKFTKAGMNFAEIEVEAQRLIKAEDCIPNFALVPGYHWATCIMRNDEMCHGIPSKDKLIRDGDLITIDVGLLYKEYNLDTTASFVIGSSPEKEEFLAIGKKALAKAIERTKAGNTVYDVSFAMQKVIERHGYSMVYQLTGHGIGKKLHDDPAIPCIAQKSDKRKTLYEGQTICVEVMYAMGDAYLVLDKDGWTYRTEDGSLAGMIEETVLVTEKGPEILTK